MTYYNGNPYHGPTESAPLDKWCHDGCLPADQLETVMLADFSTGHADPETGCWTWDMVPHVHQRWPWHWTRVYGAGRPCYVCGQPVEIEVRPGIWQPAEPGVLEVRAA